MFRRAHRPAVTVGALAALVAIAAPCAAEWKRLDSPNFVVVGDVGAGTLRDVAIKFESFRDTLTRLLSERATTTPVPTVVIVFPSDRAFRPFQPIYQGKPVALSGLFVPGRDANFIAIGAEGGGDGLQVVFHEYAHLVVTNVMRNIPAWLNEGLAEYYSTYEMRDGGREAVIGRAIVPHLRLLQETSLLKLDDLLNVDRDSPLYNERDRASVFYAQSWALTHRILLGQPARTAELTAYLRRVSEGMAPMQAWEQAFGAAKMESELHDYVRRRLFQAVQYKFPEKLAQFDTAATPIPAADAEAFLAEFLVQQRRYDEAAARVSSAAKLAPDNVRLKLVSALLDVARSDYDKAAERLPAVGDPADWLVAYSAAMGMAGMVEGRGETPTPEQVQTVRRLLEVVRGQRAELPNALARLAMMELRSAAGPTKDTRAAIERARRMAPGREDYAFVHAQVLAHLSDFAAARSVVGPLIAGVYGPQVREPARSLMAYIVRMELQSQNAGATGPGVSVPDTDGKTSSSADGSRPLFRELEAGEQRIEGLLERIACAAGGEVVFHIRTAGGPVRAAAAGMGAVDFVTYRDDLPMSVSCGPLKAPVPVYLTWRAGTGKPDGKVAVAIEFLPK